MRFPQCDALVAWDRRIRRSRHFDRLAAADRRAQRQARHAVIAERHILAQVMRIGESQLLMGCLQRRGVAVLQIERRRILRKLRSVVPLRQVESRGEPSVPAEACIGVPMDIEPALAPGAGNDQGLDEVALHAVEIGRFVMFVQQSERHQE